MKIYLVGGITTGNIHADKIEGVLQKIKSAGLKLNVLESFFDTRKRRSTNLYRYVDSLMIDSGAFSFVQSGKHVDWDEYVANYINYINENKIKLFFELDIDKLIGYERVKEIRRKIERGTTKQVIPVWHKRLGKEEFLKMCDEYNYVAIGGIVSKEISKDVVVMSKFPCFSYCEHHLALIYNLKISVGYFPQGKVIGLSKIARIVDMVCRRLQLQEKICADIVEIMSKIVGDDVIAYAEGEHSCMTARGIKKIGAITKTLAYRGEFEFEENRNEFFSLI